MEKKLSFINFYSHPRFWRHTVLWIGCMLFMFGVFCWSTTASEGEIAGEDIWNIIGFLVELIVMIYVCFYAYNKLIPKKKYLAFFAVFILTVVVVSYVDHLMSTTVVQMGDIQGFWANVILFPIFVIVAFGFKLGYHGVRQLFIINRLEAKQTESELKLLKSQINPHFLFNTLNNIYSTNLEDHEKANDIILELADLLRYQLESNKKTLTQISDEIKSLENYMALEKIRVRDCKVKVEKNGHFNGVEIVPLLLLPFVENAFKYGTGLEQGDINIRFDINDQRLFSFYCKNKIVQKNGKVHSGGIGLDNVRKRLELMYRGKYELSINNDDQSHFIIDLKIQL